ncbi:MAG: hypothetical protein IRY95_10040 [Clostridia bacterium]|nr:hypothetical protein [Clostridia bacterium]
MAGLTAGPTLAVTGPLPSPGSPPASIRRFSVPVLTYHHVLPDEYLNAARHPLLAANPMIVDVGTLRRHLAYIRRRGYHAISPDQLADALAGRAGLPPKPILLTFDDGYESFYRYVFPLL